MSNMPLIVLAFAHERSESNPPVRNLLKEQLQVSSLLSPMVQQNLCEIHIAVNCTVERLSELIEQEGYRIIGLHYASDVATLIRSREGKVKSMERALKGKLGRTIGGLPQLQWIFLNGDGSQEQSEVLVKAGVPLVMRSHNLINDDAAFRLAYFFYQSLGQGQTLGEACHLAISEVRRDYVNKAKLTYGPELPSGYGSEWPFDSQTNPHLPSALSWSIHYAGDAHHKGLPKLPIKALPDLPFRDFEAFTEEDSNLFAGRSRYARELYDIAQGPYRPPVIILSGPRGSGKSSLVQAQLLPLLRKGFEVRYESFYKDGLTTLSRALKVDENISLLKEWFTQEGERERVMLKPQVVTDLMNEVQASFKNYYRSERADFAHFIRTVRAMWLREDAGEGENLLLRLGKLFNQQGQMGSTIQPGERGSQGKAPPLFVCIDQMERVLEINSATNLRRQEKFWEVLRLLCTDPDHATRGAILLVVDDAYVNALKITLNQFKVKHLHTQIPTLNKEDITDYLQRLQTDSTLREHYPLIIDERFPFLVAQDLTQNGSNEKNIGFRLHAILRRLWRRSSRRPVLWTEEEYLKLRVDGLSLSELLHQRVQDFIELMRLQGDEEFNDHLALDLLYQLSLRAIDPSLVKTSERNDSTETLEVQSMASKREFEFPQVTNLTSGEVEVSRFLYDYLGWGDLLPEPWGKRQRALADQGLWAFTQAIELGLLKGQLSAGRDLPSGVLSLIHPELADVLESRWREVNGPSSRQVQRFIDMVNSGITLTTQELEYTREAFLHTRLPNLREAQLLVDGEQAIFEVKERQKIASKQRWIIGVALTLTLVLTAARCTYISYSHETLSNRQALLTDQLKYFASERAQQQGDLSISATLLREIEAPEHIDGWRQGALRALAAPLEYNNAHDTRAWVSAISTLKTFASKYNDGSYTLWPLSSLGTSKRIGIAQYLTHSPDGSHWASLDGGELRFWPERGDPIARRIQPGNVKSIHLNAEGTVVAAVYERGDLHLLRSYEFPLKVLQGHQGAQITQATFNGRGDALLVIDEEGVLQRFKVRDDRRLSLLPPPDSYVLKSAKWAGTSDAVVALYQSAQQWMVTFYQPTGEVITLYKGPVRVRQYTSSLNGSSTLLNLGRDGLQIASSDGLGRRPLSYNQQVDQAVMHPNGRTTFLLNQGRTSGALIDLDEQSPPISIKMTDEVIQARFSPNGQWLLTTTSKGAQVWSAASGQLMQEYERRSGDLQCASLYQGELHAAFDLARQESKTQLFTWKVKPSTLSRSLYWLGDEVKEMAWPKQGKYVVTATQQGELLIWSNTGDQLLMRVQGHQGPTSVLSTFFDRPILLSASSDKSVALWNLEEGTLLKRLMGHDAGVSAATISADGERIVTGDVSGSAIVWSGAGEKIARWRPHKSRVRMLTLSPQHDLALTSSTRGVSALWRIGSGKTPQLIQQHSSSSRQAVFLAPEAGGGLLSITAKGALLRWSESGEAPITLIEASSDGRLGVLRSDGLSVLLGDRSGELLQYDTTSRSAPRSIAHGAGATSALGFLGDKGVIIGGASGEIWVWPGEGEALSLGHHEGEVVEFISSPDGMSFISRSENQAHMWLGPFDQKSLQLRLNQESHLCLNQEQRVKRLNERRDEAKEAALSCLKRKK